MKTAYLLILFILLGMVHAQQPVKHPHFPWINQQDGSKPEYVWQNVEDIIYHDNREISIHWETAPEFYAFLKKNWVFNRAMKWVRTPDGNIFCYSEGEKLELTGENEVSKWFTDPENLISKTGDRTTFTKQSTIRARDAAVLPALQFHLGQHPVLEVDVTRADCDWQFCIGIKGRAGVPLLSSGWQKGPQTISFDIADALEKKGYELNYAELNFVMGVWTGDAAKPGSVEFSASMETQPALITPMPVIKTMENAARGIPAEVLLTDRSGKPVRDKDMEITCSFLENRQRLHLSEMTYKTILKFNRKGNHIVNYLTENKFRLYQPQIIRVTDDAYYTYDKEISAIKRHDSIHCPLTGSYQGSFYFKNNGTPGETMIQGQEEWNRHNACELRLHWWESLTEKELEQRFAYLKKCGWNILHLNQGWKNWERLDAGGNIAPHGAEQLALYVRAAHKYDLCHIQDLTHYPYEEEHVWQQYKDAGYQECDWFNLWRQSQQFARMFHQYIRDVASIFKDETSIFAIGASGEGDRANQLSRSIDIMKTYQEIDHKHLFVGEPIHSYQELPHKIVFGWPQDLLGSRTYFLGNLIETELAMGIYFKLNRMIPNVCMLEGSFPAPPSYARFYFDPEDERSDPWTGKEIYRTNVRTSIYMGLTCRQPLLVTWDEQLTEDERIIFQRISRQIRWDKKLMEPEVGLFITDSLFNLKYRKIAGQYERYFTTQCPVDYKFLSDTSGFEGLVVNTLNDFQIPEPHASITPYFEISPGYAVTYTMTRDHLQILAYIYNITNHKKHRVEFSYIHRLPQPADLFVATKNLTGDYGYQIFDLDDKILIEEGTTEGNIQYEAAKTKHDYYIIINQE